MGFHFPRIFTRYPERAFHLPRIFTRYPWGGCFILGTPLQPNVQKGRKVNKRHVFYNVWRVYWSLLEPIGTYWSLLEPIGAYWSLLEPIGGYWSLLKPIGAYWGLLEPTGAY